MDARSQQVKEYKILICLTRDEIFQDGGMQYPDDVGMQNPDRTGMQDPSSSWNARFHKRTGMQNSTTSGCEIL